MGLPNAGKSSLLNSLLNEERAIVTDIAGTTRDVLKETVVFGDVVLNIIDTAGIRETSDVIEKIGVEKAKKEAEEADLILYVVDLSEGLSETDISILNNLKNKKIILVYNKSDLISDEDDVKKNEKTVLKNENSNQTGIYKEVIISSLTGYGIDSLKNLIKNMFYSGSINSEEDVIITNERHKELLISADKSIESVINSIDMGMSEDFLTIDLMDAYGSLGKIVGESVEDDLADRIFKDFCMGK